MTEDHELLRRYGEERSEGAFAELVRRRVGLVYAVALRQCGGDAHLAEDVTQKVFADLARKAGALTGRPVLSGWLYRSAHYAASDVVRSERRRRAREEENHIMNDISTGAAGGNGAVDWEKLRPVIDEAMGELGDEERDAVALRFLEEKSFAEIGRRLELSEEAARKRVSRAVGKLQGLLARRGVTSTEAALALVLANQAVATVPAGLAASVTSGALAGAGVAATGAVGASAAAAGWGTWAIFMGTTKLTVGVIGAAAVVGIGAALWGTSRATEARAALATATQEQAALSAKLEKLESRGRAEAKRMQTAEAENARLLAAAEKLKAATVAPVATEAERVTSGMVQERWRRAQALARDGDPEEALKELLWCYDVGMVQISSMSGVRSSSGTSTLAKLGERYPAALEALRERRDKARERVLADESDHASVSEFGSINRALKDDAANIALHDQLPPGDRRRGTLAFSSREFLVDQQRYKDAITGWSYSLMSSSFERGSSGESLPANVPNREAAQRQSRERFIGTNARNIEVLAGAGDLANARTLAQRLLAYDNTETTKALIQKHAERAGQPGLLTPTMPPNP